jgi:hypothetical protein
MSDRAYITWAESRRQAAELRRQRLERLLNPPPPEPDDGRPKIEGIIYRPPPK